jgi:hypothetical protein
MNPVLRIYRRKAKQEIRYLCIYILCFGIFRNIYYGLWRKNFDNMVRELLFVAICKSFPECRGHSAAPTADLGLAPHTPP